MVGQLYEQGDRRRDAGFTIFYMGVNVGAFFGQIICALLRGEPALGLALGLRVGGRRDVARARHLPACCRPQYLAGIGEPPDRAASPPRDAPRTRR